MTYSWDEGGEQPQTSRPILAENSIWPPVYAIVLCTKAFVGFGLSFAAALGTGCALKYTSR